MLTSRRFAVPFLTLTLVAVTLLGPALASAQTGTAAPPKVAARASPNACRAAPSPSSG